MTATDLHPLLLQQLDKWRKRTGLSFDDIVARAENAFERAQDGEHPTEIGRVHEDALQTPDKRPRMLRSWGGFLVDVGEELAGVE